MIELFCIYRYFVFHFEAGENCSLLILCWLLLEVTEQLLDLVVAGHIHVHASGVQEIGSKFLRPIFLLYIHYCDGVIKLFNLLK